MATNQPYLVELTYGTVGSEGIADFTYLNHFGEVDFPAEDLLTAFKGSVLPAIEDIVSTGTPFRKIVVRNLMDDGDFKEETLSPVGAGTRTGVTLMAFACVGFVSAKPTISQRPARKRFGYLSQSDCGGGVVLDTSGYFDALDSCATALGSELANSESVLAFRPIIVKRVKYTTPGGKTAYRYPHVGDAVTTFPAINWTYDPLLTSQITRKYGRGD